MIPWTVAHQAPLSSSVSWNLFKSCPVSWWCYLTISSSATPFSFCLQSFPASGSFPMIQLFALSSQSIGASASVSVLPKIIQGWFPLGLIGLISCSPRDSWEFLQHHNSKASILWGLTFFMVQLSHLYMTTGKTTALSIQKFVSKVMSLLFNILSGFVIAVFPRSKGVLISWLQSPSTVILEPTKIKSFTVFHLFSTYLPWSDDTGCHDLSSLNVDF